MCRLYGFLANEPTKVECTLARAQNALLRQSRKDSLGRPNVDGWGIACYRDGTPCVERKATAAFADAKFSETAANVFSTAVVAHVRLATVGEVSKVNSHPFAYGCWTFAHNGGLTAFDQIRQQLESETDASLQACRLGTTDSEQIFYWLLTRMARAGLSLDQACQNVNDVAEIVSRSVRDLANCNDAVGPTEPARLNFILTDGVHLIATRWRNSLYSVHREGVHDCEVCGIPHVQHRPSVDYRAAIIASEPISSEAWMEVPDRTLITVDESIALTTQTIE